MANTRAQKTAQNLSTLTTAGDIAYASAAGTPARLGIGSSAQVLTVASGVPSWATPSSGSTFVGCSVFASAAQSTTQTTDTAAAFNSENYDTDAFHSTTVNNSRITIPAGKGGYYKVTFTVRWNNGSYCDVKLLKNGTRIALGTQAGNIGGQNVSGSPNFIGTFDLALVATDYVQLALNSDATTGNNLDNCVFSVIYLGA